MNSLKFPDMLSSAKTNLVYDKEAVASNVRLLLQSDQGELFGDPGYGAPLMRHLFEQNSILLKDIVIDAVYVSVLQFMPQLFIKREDINIIQEEDKLYCTINCINKQDNQPNMLQINLITDELAGGR